MRHFFLLATSLVGLCALASCYESHLQGSVEHNMPPMNRVGVVDAGIELICEAFSPPEAERFYVDDLQSRVHGAAIEQALFLAPWEACGLESCGVVEEGDEGSVASACLCRAWAQCRPAHYRSIRGAGVGPCMEDVFVGPDGEGACEISRFSTCALELSLRTSHPAGLVCEESELRFESSGERERVTGIAISNECGRGEGIALAAERLATLKDVEGCACVRSDASPDFVARRAECIVAAADDCQPAFYSWNEVREEGSPGASTTIVVAPSIVGDGLCEILRHVDEAGVTTTSRCSDLVRDAEGRVEAFGCTSF